MEPLASTEDKHSNMRKRRHSDEEETIIIANQKKDKKEGEKDQSATSDEITYDCKANSQ